MVIPAVLSLLLILVLAGVWFAGGFEKTALDADEIHRFARSRGWHVEVSTQGSSRGVYALSPADSDARIVLRRSERSHAGGQFQPIARMTGGSGTAWFAPSPAADLLLVVAPGCPVPAGTGNDVLAGPAAALLRPLLTRAMRDLTGGDVPLPERLIGFTTGDATFDAAHLLLSDQPDRARQLLRPEVRAALASSPEPSLVMSRAGVQLALEGNADFQRIDALMAAGDRVRRALPKP